MKGDIIVYRIGEIIVYRINTIISAACIQCNCNTELLCMRAGGALDSYRVKYRDVVEILEAEILLLTTQSKLQLSTRLSGKFAKEKPGRVKSSLLLSLCQGKM